MTTSRPRVLLVYQRLGLPWVFDAAERAGIDLVLVPRPGEALPERLPAAVVDALPLDVLGDEAGATERVEALHAAAPLAGVVTLFEGTVPFVARVAARLGLPGLEPSVALVARDKRAMRHRFAAAGVPAPAAVALAHPDAWRDAAGLAFPVVVKPAGGYSSHGVMRVDDPGDLARATAAVWDLVRGEFAAAVRADAGALRGLVVEEFVGGLELAVDALTAGGEVAVLAVAEKGRPQGPHFEESVHRAPARLDAALIGEVCAISAAAGLALGIEWGPTHTELRLGADGRPRVLEVGARIGGSGVCHHVVAASTGVDYAALVLRQAAGEPVALPPAVHPPPASGANYIIPCQGSGVIAAIDGLEEVERHEATDLVVRFMGPGDLVRGYPDFSGYPGFVLSHHASTADAAAFHDWLDATIRVRYEPGTVPA